jgi:hypothetical protein
MSNLLHLRLVDFLNNMQDPRKVKLIQIYNEHKDLFHISKGSNTKHQAWPGGYADHLTETFRVNQVTYEALATGLRKPPFSKDSAIISLFFHDAEKLFKYGPQNHTESNQWRALQIQKNLSWEDVKYLVIEALICESLESFFTQDERNALKYTHGEGSDYQKDKHVSCPLAAHVHHCDNTSSNIYRHQGQGLG